MAPLDYNFSLQLYRWGSQRLSQLTLSGTCGKRDAELAVVLSSAVPPSTSLGWVPRARRTLMATEKSARGINGKTARREASELDPCVESLLRLGARETSTDDIRSGAKANHQTTFFCVGRLITLLVIIGMPNTPGYVLFVRDDHPRGGALAKIPPTQARFEDSFSSRCKFTRHQVVPFTYGAAHLTPSFQSFCILEPPTCCEGPRRICEQLAAAGTLDLFGSTRCCLEGKVSRIFII